ncbi:MAG: hypothetical protein KAT43_06520 [Nanoarchaeota archaeon]|nr:hypothetical protein [Nanoarchaeota archaeon]
MNPTEINEQISHVEEVVLDGERFPNGRPYDGAEARRKLQIAVPRIIRTYETLQEIEEEHQDLLTRIFYFARDLSDDNDLWFFEDKDQTKKLCEIAKQGRELSLANPATEEERIKQGRLYRYKDESVFAAQIQDLRRGCSASVCSNCDEPIAFCNYECPVCNYELIGVHGMGDRSEQWRLQCPDLRKNHMALACAHMIEDIRQRGDWRGTASPLNRYMDDKSKWGGSSSRSGGTPLLRISE